MPFLAPFMLWGAVAAGIPIALHFFFRSRYRTVPWAAMKFLLDSIEQTSRRLKFQELLLLLLRVALLVVLALALARPISSALRGAGQGTSVDAVFLFDTSMSMGGADGVSKSRLQRAQDAALSIIDQLPPHSTVQIITCADRAEIDVAGSDEAVSTRSVLGLLGPRSPRNLDQAKAIIEELRPTSLGTDLTDGIALILPAFKKTDNSNKEVYIFTDLQRSGWETHPNEVKKMMAEIGEKAAITIVKCGQQELTNAAVVSVAPQTEIPRPGERVDFAVQVRHTSGKDSIKGLQLTLQINGRNEEGGTKTIDELKKGETQNIILSGKLTRAGLHTVTVLMTGGKDDIPGDNRFDYVVRVPDYFRILVVDGGNNDPEDREQEKLASSYFLMHQIAPVPPTDYGKFHVQQTRVRAKGAAAALLTPGANLEKLDLCVLANCRVPPVDKLAPPPRNSLSHEFMTQLKHYVKEGGSLLIYSGDQIVDYQDYNEVMGKQYNLLPVPLKGKVKDFGHKAPIFVDRKTFNLPAYQEFKEKKLFEAFNLIKIYKAFEVEEPTRGEVKQEEPGALGEDTRQDLKKPLTDEEKQKKAEEDERKAEQEKKDENITVALRYTNNWPAVVSRRIGQGEVIFITTSADPGGLNDTDSVDNRDQQFTWNNWATNPFSTVFMKRTLAHLIAGSSQDLNFTAGKTFTWNARDKAGKFFTLYHPRAEEPKKDDKDKNEDKPAAKKEKRKIERLGTPTREENTGKLLVRANDLYQSGIYLIEAMDPADEARDDDDDRADGKFPVAVVPDPNETLHLEAFENKAFDEFLQLSTPVRHLLAGTNEVKATGTDRFHQEWTIWLLWLLLILAICEVGLAWFCGRAW
jgi:hypothetical protein